MGINKFSDDHHYHHMLENTLAGTQILLRLFDYQIRVFQRNYQILQTSRCHTSVYDTYGLGGGILHHRQSILGVSALESVRMAPHRQIK